MQLSSVKNKITFYPALIIFIFCLFYCYDYLLQISISVFLPEIKAQFYLNDFSLGLIGSIFFVSYVLMQIPAGYLIDRFGPWWISLAMSLLCGVGTFAMYLSAHTYWLLLFSRLLIGLGSSFSFLCAIKIISSLAPLRFFSFFVGVLQALAGFGAIVGQTPLAYLNLYYAWNKLALLFFIAALLFSVCFFIFIKKYLDLSTTKKEEHHHAYTWKAVLSVLKNKSLVKISFLSFIAWSPVASLAGFWLVQYLQGVSHQTTLVAGSMISVFWVGVILGSILIPLISEWMQRRKPLLVGSFCLQLFSVTLIMLFPLYTNSLIMALFLLGMMSPIQGFCVVLAKDLNLPHGFGLAAGLINMFGSVSGGVMQLVIGFLLTYVFHGSRHPYELAFSSYLLLALFGLFICVFSYKESHPLTSLGGIYES